MASTRIDQRWYFFLSDFYHWGGTVTFTAHLLNSIGKNKIVMIDGTPKNSDGDFGYNIQYQTHNSEILYRVKYPFITDFFKRHDLLKNFRCSDVTLVIHDPTEITEEIVPYLKTWNIICIRKTFQNYLNTKYDVDAKFIYHPFYPYPKGNSNHSSDHGNAKPSNAHQPGRIKAVAISRVDYGKNTKIILDANKILKRSDRDSTIKLHGPFNPKYVEHVLGGKQNLYEYYNGTFEKSFGAIASILDRAKFVVDLSVIHNDGGGTQYTFLEAIYHGAALIINRNWINGIDSKYCDFEEDYNCYAVSDAEELAQIIKDKDLDTTRIVNNAQKLMERHVHADWSAA